MVATISTIWTFIVILFALALGIAIVYLGLAAVGLILSLPFIIARGIVYMVAAGVGIFAAVLYELIVNTGKKFLRVLRFKKTSHKSNKSSQYREKANDSGHKVRASHDIPFNPYRVLQVASNASLDEIKAAYHQQMTKYHPDKVAHLGEELQVLAEEKAKTIQRAYSALNCH